MLPTGPAGLSLALAAVTTVCLLVGGLPLAWWLARTPSRWRPWVEALVALPLLLPPTVLGFYLLVLLGPAGVVGRLWEAVGGPRLVFSFHGLVVGSIVFSLPFVVQPLVAAFRAVPPRQLEVAAVLGATPGDVFWSVVLPQARWGLLSAAVLGFAHTLGEFGVVLMLGGNIPGRTRVLSTALYTHVEVGNYAAAHAMAALLVAVSFAALVVVYGLGRGSRAAVGPAAQ